MISGTFLIFLLFLAPIVGVMVCALPLNGKAAMRTSAFVSAFECAVAAFLWYAKGNVPRMFGCGDVLFLDTLSLYHVSLVAVVFLFSSIYAVGYFASDIKSGLFDRASARRFGMLWNGFLAVLMAVLCSNNMGLLWISLEASTLVSALLILTRGKPASVEAMWKYLILCSVGIAFAFVGTLLLSVAARGATSAATGSLLWTTLSDNAVSLNGNVACAAFIFALVGFGTKAGLAPMHTWLPDAHSQAPTPVSAVFSGVMLSCAMYCIMRYLSICEPAMGFSGRPHAMLIGFGLLSIAAAAVFIPFQKNIKRFLAYSSVEHIGIVALGLGLGGLGTVAALFHTLNHSMAKPLAFFSAGNLARQYDSHDMHAVSGAVSKNRLWGGAFLAAVLALAGMAPFAVFMSEFQIVKATVDTGRYIQLALFLAGAIVVFASATRHAIAVSLGNAPSHVSRYNPRAPDYAVVGMCLIAMLAFGLWMPDWLKSTLQQAAIIIENRAALPWSLVP